jgi:hypothetical protein
MNPPTLGMPFNRLQSLNNSARWPKYKFSRFGLTRLSIVLSASGLSIARDSPTCGGGVIGGGSSA